MLGQVPVESAANCAIDCTNDTSWCMGPIGEGKS
jgi:hypothetical protein